MNLGATLIGSLLAVLARPATWPLALLGFLVRGGWLLIVAPIVVVPTPVGLANILAPLLEDVAFGRRTAELTALVAVVIVIAVGWLIVGGVVAAVAEADGIRRAARAPTTSPTSQVSNAIANASGAPATIRPANGTVTSEGTVNSR